MKKMIIGLTIIFIGLAINVQAANVTFDPAEARFEVEPGNSGRANLKVNGSSSGSYTLLFKVGSKLEKGNIPIGWLSPAYVSLTSRTGEPTYSSMDLIVNIPPDAVAGTYSGRLLPEDLRSTESISSDGINVSIQVATPQIVCTTPVISGIELEPENIWAPTDREVEIVIRGTISDADVCEVAASYRLESDNGPVQGEIALAPGGFFQQSITVNVSRSGKDKSGRTYNGSVSAMNSEGHVSSVPFSVTVLHDKGHKSELAQ